jgi:arsenite methyltransferase
MEHYLQRKIDYLLPIIANAYDELPFWSAPFGMQLFLEMPMPRAGRVLDIGCGTGFPLTVLAARLGPQVELTGIDPWAAARDHAEQRLAAYALGHAKVMDGDAAHLPFPDGHFDMVVGNLVINNVADVPAMFSESLRVLKPGGRLCISTNLNGTFKEIYGLLTEAMAHLSQPEALHEIARSAAARRSRLQVCDLFHQAGFVQVRSKEDNHFMRWSGGGAFLNDPLVVMGFLPSWKALVPEELHAKVFAFVERSLDAWADEHGSVGLSLPVLYAEGQKGIN